ncbi:apoptosis facilitator Bcl-2-like protein 14 isoform X1 [Bos javanicus]|uniref:apoptosis facilitator Bcl-2-like protein 14 isoform X1 n=1 Tax=Bos javanicus TaxID=9906 RepID=UPI002AA794A4|nr:apoptosis facilitator Bcl-2-like protein 14 isoform X1 [Bos javanicus]XP_061273814.1 apoptosis facilitator Bcl-2-like protein 14 isoform X1 [Bos javanicus]XP_061273815.1 apoptosis facilitator Bcl-2-like protein 14 isoform X1 [Bos javanicus]XP_061273816.1 apoptosis facilitator Bcl-2-like protein 14 isoform X1 [Bos javanicus]XP_061273817.1 apoptosis facilitator Bcl-2-like protein 14 isoform X1 [Bos javanicus]XP_061273818.1 apoptosis facilitator Bcl-2-like protein 14 isoform X1 [Bos javanicus]
MCTASPCDLEEIPLDDEDSDSLEFKILEFYVKHHVFQNTSAILSPKHLRTRSLSQKGPERWPVSEAWTQGPWPCRHSQSSEKAINLTKKKSSWRTLFGVAEKEEDSQSSPPEICAQAQRSGVPQARPRSPKWPRSRSSMDQRLEHKAADPRVVSIANRVAEIVYSWPPPEELHSQGGGFKSKGVLVFQGPQGQSGAESTKKACGSLSQTPVDDEGPSWLLSLQHLELQGRRFSSHGGALQPQNQTEGEDQIIARIVELLKYSGEQLERELKKDKVLMTCFQDVLSYSVVKTITDQFLRGVDTRGESEVKAQSFKAALAIDVIAKLTTIDNHPMNRVLGFGTKYLKENFSPWIQQHGGWEKILRMPHEEVD